ncbi:hypothetical protein EV191_11367 [Tamaricihabitans halophyticus]|uniref:Uncharacterized protein n=1 Tax=Tamaricihabitans halophyticus TaxID=1262583 RepID=A0A4R2QIH7_9PSEU|nr:hypothetical protein [Tamaricihabitans halophyticus]TCP46791.1 hypothetical protein EV191_11367 [Tamaricihabitans halophyticus]
MGAVNAATTVQWVAFVLAALVTTTALSVLVHRTPPNDVDPGHDPDDFLGVQWARGRHGSKRPDRQ